MNETLKKLNFTIIHLLFLVLFMANWYTYKLCSLCIIFFEILVKIVRLSFSPHSSS